MPSGFKHFAIFFFLFFLGYSQAFSQGTTAVQIEDYVILQNGRRFDGTVIRTKDQLNFEQIEFLRRGETVIYTPEDIRSFGLGTGEFFQSGRIKSTGEKKFFRLFIEGSVDLGIYKSNYYAGSEEEMVLLTDKGKSLQGDSDLTNNEDYKTVLRSLLTGNCGEKMEGSIRGTKLNEDDLVSLFSKYLECKKEDFSLFREFRPVYILSPLVRLGVFESGIKSHIKTGDRKDLLTSTPVIQGYAGLSIHTFRKYPRFLADAGLAFETSKLTWESQYIGPSIKNTGTEEIAHSFISLPLTINFSLIKTRKTDFFIGIGGGYGVSISDSEFAIQEEKATFSDRITLTEGSFTTVSSGGFFFHGQTGFLVNLPSNRAITFSAIFRQLGDYYSVKVGTNTANYHKLDFGFGVGFRF